MTKRPRIRRLFRFSLRTMLALIGVFGVWLSAKVNQAQQQKAAVEWVRQTGGTVLYDYEIVIYGPLPFSDSERKPPGPRWLRDLTGIDYFATVEFVAIGRNGWVDLSPLAKFKGLKIVRLGLPSELGDVSKPDISSLTHLKDLRYLMLGKRDVSEADAARLQAALPECDITYLPY